MHPYYTHIHGRAHTKGFVNEACTAYIVHLMCMLYIFSTCGESEQTVTKAAVLTLMQIFVFLCCHFIAIYLYIYI